MAARSISEMKRVRYLLGLSSPAERELIESEYFEDDDAFQKMLTAEDDLIDAYARGELTGEERRRFETSSLRGRDRVKFARAFAGAVSVTEARLPNPFALLRTATIAVMIVFLAVLAWLVTDRRRMSEELRELRAESVELSKRVEALQQGNGTQRTRATDVVAQLAEMRAQPDKPTDGQKIAGTKHINTQNASRDNAAQTKITDLPILGRRWEDLRTLQPTITRDGSVAGNRADQANLALAGVENLKNASLISQNTISIGENTIRIPSLHRWIRFQIALEAAAIHEDYRLTIKTAEGHLVTSVDWIEPLTPNQTIIDTPAISTSDLPSGDYVLLLMGKGPDGLFVNVAEYRFRVIRD